MKNNILLILLLIYTSLHASYIKNSAYLENSWVNLSSTKKETQDLHKFFIEESTVLDNSLAYTSSTIYYDLELQSEQKSETNLKENQKLKQDNKVKQYSLERAENLRMFLLVILAALCIVAMFIYVAYKKNQRFALELSHTNSIVNQQRNEIASSLDIEKDLNNKLNAANSSLERFFSIIAHDLRGPYNIMLGYADILTDNFDSLTLDEIKKYVITLHKAAHKNYQLTQNLLSWAILQKGGITVNKETLNAKNLIDESISIYEELAAQKRIKLINRCPKELTGSLDKNIVTSILSNLINNAIKYTPQNGTIHISAKKLSTLLVFKVDDNGIGISKAAMKNLFELTKMTSKQGTANEPGSGLGLILCKELAATHKGEIRVKSILGKGTTVLALL
ncbi:sensor histidine kinase [Ascidiimonas sp. W6]|uniref:sensor histidine kinase n=1 Tax=Ascidiimonas meishanensis TaxID=3128903 RepID=UPI0030ED510B